MTTQPEQHILTNEEPGGLDMAEIDDQTADTVSLPRLPKASVQLYEVSKTKPSSSLSAPPKTTNALVLLNTKPAIKHSWRDDYWLLMTILIGYITSLAAFWYFFQTHQIVLYGDAYAHMLITRRVFDNVTPGLAQLGGVWLPLPHVVMLPFIWNNYLWRTGLAGAIPSMICYLVASVYIFLSARRLTHNSPASFIGTLVFIFNPNVLYLQTTALSEIVLIATLTAASYYFLAWAQEDKLNYLMLSGFATFLATLSRYDGWFLLVTMFLLIVPIGLLKRQRKTQIEGNLIMFASIGGLGILLWLAWCFIIFGNPLYFQNGPFSSQAQQKSLINAHVLFTYHSLWQSIRYYTIDSLQNLGPLLFILAIIAIILFLALRRITPETLATLAFLSPFVFYVVSLYTGQAAIYVPIAVPANFEHQIYNARYGVEVIAPAAVFIATLINSLSPPRLHWLRRLGQTAFVALIITQAVIIALGGIISLQDGQSGLDCAHAHPIIVFLAQHYDGGKILEDLYDTKMDALNPEAQIDFKNVIYEGSGLLWKQALRQPASMVSWIIVNPANQYDQVANNLTPAFNAQFTRDIEESSGLSLYHRNGLVYPTRPVPSYLVNEHSLCLDPS
jgi:hypothetical protein